jgi:penicillin-binding protein 1A
VLRLGRFLGVIFSVAVLLALVAGGAVAWAIAHYGRDLPSVEQLAEYAPPTVTRIHAGNGALLAEYARERRVFVPIDAIPLRVRQAFISAEDQNFYEHSGIDLIGIARAALSNIRQIGTDRRPIGASTITQQVARNFLLSDELSIDRKIREAILAWRIERTFTKDHILELYLNQIFLGRRSYGVAAAALNYFDKSLDDLTLGETAFLAGTPKAPSRYDPERFPAEALARRNYVIGRMLEDGRITADEAEAARAEPLRVAKPGNEDAARADFFTEEVRRQLVARYGEAGFYEGGLSVRTTVEPHLQAVADAALREGLSVYDRRQGWRGPLGRLELPPDGRFEGPLSAFDPGIELGTWRKAVVLEVAADRAALGLTDGRVVAMTLADARWARPAGNRSAGELRSLREVIEPGDVVLVEPVGEGSAARWELRQIPEIEGAVVALDPHTGRVLAMSGGFSFRQSKFNRATQALRQPGSAFKPFVYLAAMEAGLTPSTVIDDSPIEIDQGPGLPPWKPSNYADEFLGEATLRTGLEKSRNVMTVKIAQQIGMNRVRDVAHRFGIDRGLEPHLAAALGSNEVDLLHLACAYGMLVNGGRWLEPSLIDRVQDRNGRTILRRDDRSCDRCRAPVLTPDTLPPAPVDERPQVADPRHVFQVVSMLEGVVQRGTARPVAKLGVPLAGKTGTTNDSRDVWFVGFSPDLVVGVYVGFDQPRSLGERETGGSTAVPIFIRVMAEAIKGKPAVPFRVPSGLKLVRVDHDSGLLASGNGPGVITEAFLPGTEPLERAEAQRARGSDPALVGIGESADSAGGIY